MSLAPRYPELRARARADLRMGLPVVLCDGGTLALVAAVETLDAERFATLARDAAAIAVTARRAGTLRARPYDGDQVRLALPPDATLGWAQAVADPATDLRHPMKGPFRELRGEDMPGAALARAGIRLCKEARLLPTVMLRVPEPGELTGLTLLDLKMESDDAPIYRETVAAHLPMDLAGPGRLHVFRPDDGGEEHYAIEVGRPERPGPVLARLHSACFTGDLLGSLKCDCGPQLRGALAAMGAEGAGVLLYLNQEGRGIGLANKMRAYALQDQGFDTVEANHRLGFEDDERDFRIGSALLAHLGFEAVRLMTNNPAKISMMTAQGIKVTERVPLSVGKTDENAAYLATKAARSGHLL